MANVTAEKLRLQTDKFLEVKLGKSFYKMSRLDSRSMPESYHTVRYDFKPASIDTNKMGSIEFEENHKVTISAPNLENSGHHVFKGSKKPHNKECVLIIDHVTGEITLERLTHNIAVKKTRAERINAERINAEKVAPAKTSAPSGMPSKSSGKRGNDNGSTSQQTTHTKNGGSNSHSKSYSPNRSVSPEQTTQKYSNGYATGQGNDQWSPVGHAANHNQSNLPQVNNLLSMPTNLFQSNAPIVPCTNNPNNKPAPTASDDGFQVLSESSSDSSGSESSSSSSSDDDDDDENNDAGKVEKSNGFNGGHRDTSSSALMNRITINDQANGFNGGHRDTSSSALMNRININDHRNSESSSESDVDMKPETNGATNGSLSMPMILPSARPTSLSMPKFSQLSQDLQLSESSGSDSDD